MDGVSAIAASAISLSGTTLPRRHAPSPVTSTLHSASLIRSRSESDGEAAEHHRVGGAEPGAREHRDRELGHHPEVDRDPVALLDAERLQRVRGPADLVEELGVGDRARVAGLALPEEGDLVAVAGLDVAVDAVVRAR